MNRFIKVILCLAIIPIYSFGQKFDVNNYKPIESFGELPIDFRLTSEQKFKEDKAEISKDEKRFDRKTKEKFLLQTNFMLDNMLLSGKILFNDPLTNYVNKVANELLKGDENEALRKEVRIYVTKSPYVNAFSTDQGVILVNIGLLAQLENEAQLAYVIAHELVHYAKKHGINLFVETEKISKGRDGYRSLSQNDLYLNKNVRSRENEMEADELGLIKYYSQSNYCLEELDGVFDVLQYSYLPFDDMVFDTTYFNTEYYKLPNEYFLTKVDAIKGGEDYDEEKSTHPSIDKRRREIADIIEEMDNTGRLKFILPKEDFENVRAQARFEVIRQQLIYRNYPEVIYNCYVLLKKYPDNKFLKTAIASSLYGLAKYKINGGYNDVCESYNKIEGESQQVFHLFKKIDKKELNVIALEYAWSLHQEYPNDKYLYKISDDLMKELVMKNKLSSKDFYEKTKEEVKNEMSEETEELDTLKLSKYDKIKRKRKIKEIKSDNAYEFAFVSLFKDKEFKNRFAYWDEQCLESKSDIDVDDMDYKERKEYYREQRKEAKQLRKYGYALGIDTMVLVDPAYYKIDERKETQIRYIDSERKQFELNQMLVKNAQLAGINLSLIDSKNLKSDDTDVFNDLALLNDWIIECFSHEDMDFVMSESQYINEIVEKYNTKYFSWFVLFNVREKQKHMQRVCYYTMGFYTIPIAIYYLVKPEFSTHYYNVLFNVESGKAELSVAEDVNQNDNRDWINSKVYDTFFQIKSKRKK
ncbi:MAG: M48 family metallopeptidase [Saprospiraceae bacterium]|nr:M48 family metallopeptidase [Saprospiraceae bacterium]